MTQHLRYLKIVLKHKWFVLVAGLRIGGIPFHRLLIHDWTKLTPVEWGPYMRRFASGAAHQGLPGDEDWQCAWRHHWQHNPHHWEYWRAGDTVREIPESYVREMVADWQAAGRAYSGKWDAPAWYKRQQGKIMLHSTTRYLVEELLRRCHEQFPAHVG